MFGLDQEAINYSLLILYVVIVGATKSKDAMLALFAFLASFCYAYMPIYGASSLFDYYPSYINHLTISMIFLVFAIFMRKPCAVATLVYIGYHWIVAGDALIYPYQDLISTSFTQVATTLNIFIMLAILYDRFITDYRSTTYVGSGWIADFIRNTRLAKKMEGREKC